MASAAPAFTMSSTSSDSYIKAITVTSSLLLLEDVWRLESLGPKSDPFGHSNLDVTAAVDALDLPGVTYQPKTAVTNLHNACSAMFGRTQGIVQWETEGEASECSSD